MDWRNWLVAGYRTCASRGHRDDMAGGCAAVFRDATGLGAGMKRLRDMFHQGRIAPLSGLRVNQDLSYRLG
jgi:hypothetical protein